MSIIFGGLTNGVADAVPLLAGPLNGLPWYLPARSSGERCAMAAGLAMGPGIFGSFGSEIHGGCAAFARMARHYEAEGGTLGDPEAAPNLSLAPGMGGRAAQSGTGRATIDLSADYRLLFDGDAGQILVDHRPSGTQTAIWGQTAPDGTPQLWEESWFGLDDGTAIAITTAPAIDHADGFMPTSIDLTRDGRTMTLRAGGGAA